MEPTSDPAPAAAVERSSRTDADPRGRWIGWGGLLALAVIVRLPGLTSPLWVDEEFTLQMARQPVSSLIETGASLHPPGYPLSARALLAVFGQPWAIRLPALIGGLLAVAAVGALVKELGQPRLAAWAALVLALSVYAVYYSQEARGYSWMSAAVGWAAVFGCRALRDPASGGSKGALLAGLVAIGFHYLALPSAAAIAAVVLGQGAWTRTRGAASSSRSRAVFMVAVASSMVLAAWLLRHRIDSVLIVLERPATTAVAVGPRLVAETLGRWIGVGSAPGYVLAGLLVVGALVGLRTARSRGALVLAACGAPFLLFACLPWSLKFEMRYLMAGLVPGLALVTLGVGAMLRWSSHLGSSPRSFERLAPLPFALVLAFQGPVLWRWWRQPVRMLQGEDTRPFGARYLTLQSRLNPWLVRSLATRDFEVTGWRLGPLAVLLPDWSPEPTSTEPVGGRAVARWVNPLADECLELSVEARGAVGGPRVERRLGPGNCVGTVRTRYHSGTGERVGSTDLVGHCADCGLRFALRVRSSRLERVDALLSEFAATAQCLAGSVGAIRRARRGGVAPHDFDRVVPETLTPVWQRRGEGTGSQAVVVPRARSRLVVDRPGRARRRERSARRARRSQRGLLAERELKKDLIVEIQLGKMVGRDVYGW